MKTKNDWRKQSPLVVLNIYNLIDWLMILAVYRSRRSAWIPPAISTTFPNFECVTTHSGPESSSRVFTIIPLLYSQHFRTRLCSVQYFYTGVKIVFDYVLLLHRWNLSINNFTRKIVITMPWIYDSSKIYLLTLVGKISQKIN